MTAKQLSEYVSILAPARGATTQKRPHTTKRKSFNPRSREGSDEFVVVQRSWIEMVSILAPARGATEDGYFYIRALAAFQSSLPRGERQNRKNSTSRVRNVSILAPARGATGRCARSAGCRPVSILAPARGATGAGSNPVRTFRSFNPRSREGSDSNFSQKSPYIFS